MDYKERYEKALKRAEAAIDIAADKDLVKGVATTIFPELRESKDERISREITEFIVNFHNGNYVKPYDYTIGAWLAWLEKQGEKPADARIVWHDVSEEPEEMKELLVEWDSEDATWHEVAFYGATSKTFNVNGKQLEGVTRWCYIDDIVKEQAPKTKWTKEDEAGLGDALWAIERAKTTVKNENEMGNLWYAESWLKSIKQRLEKL